MYFDDPSKAAMTLATTMDICKPFRHTMKQMIKKVEQTMLLSRNDVIDVVGKSDGINKNVKFLAEDIITDGSIKVKLMVRTISEFNNVDYDENIFH
ncbi:hypothetical protein M9Y10_035102 [Tritrichomonas musculus]|uniref:Uncharacterized protein n=1 Tax=Tritrichomonas musculus TaxID=1915356 RepID=A0ABR2KHN6_9EUKA